MIKTIFYRPSRSHFFSVLIGYSLISLLFVTSHISAAPSETAAESVVVVANMNQSESVKLALHYLEQRKIPEKNLILLEAPESEIITWSQFIESIYNPLIDTLIEQGWIEALTSGLFDSHGRRRFAVTKHNISYLVICRGIPLKIKNDNERLANESMRHLTAEFKTNHSSLEAELSLLAVPQHPITGWVPNPLFKRDRPTYLENQLVIKVSRLDGPDLNSAMALVDNAIQAESSGLAGQAYIDRGRKHEIGDRWLKKIEEKISSMGYVLNVERSKKTFQSNAQFDEPALYFGWYANRVNGPFLKSDFHFPPGAIAVHIHSYSAETLRNPNKNWCAPLIAKGVTATLGNVYESYLEFTHHLDDFFEALSRDWTLGDAAYYALPTLSWQAVLIGDPLYRPFKVASNGQN